MRHFVFACAVMALLGIRVPAAQAEDLLLRMPTFLNGREVYFYDLLGEAMRAAGHSLTIEKIRDLPTPRLGDALENGEIDALYAVRTQARDHRFIPIPVPLTDGLLGQRLLFIPRGEQAQYDGVTNLTDFKALGKTAGAGKGWVDVTIWHANGMAIYEHPRNWLNLYAMIASRRNQIDYMTRSVTEILGEQSAAQEAGLEMEQHLLLVYDADAIFYLSPKRAELVPIFTAALTQAREQGVIRARARAHWARDLGMLGLAQRTVITFLTPREIAAGQNNSVATKP